MVKNYAQGLSFFNEKKAKSDKQSNTISTLLLKYIIFIFCTNYS